MKLVWVEIHQDQPVRIFKNHKLAIQSGVPDIQQVPKAEAVDSIRRYLYDKAEGRCEHCGKPVKWDSDNYWERAEMNEKTPKGRGGEVSIWNGEILCYDCHQGPNGVHGDRKWGGRG